MDTQSLASLPSLVALGLTYVPAGVARPDVKRWGPAVVDAPRTAHVQQRFARPAQNLSALSAHLEAHTACGGHHGAIHSVVALAQAVAADRAAGAGGGARSPVRGNPLNYGKQLVLNLQARAAAEADLRAAQAGFEELEKRFWLSRVLDARGARAAGAHRASRSAHAALRARGGGGGSAAEAREAASARRAAAAVAARWKHVPAAPDQGPPPYALRSPGAAAPPRAATLLTPREGGVGVVQVASPKAAALLAEAQAEG